MTVPQNGDISYLRSKQDQYHFLFIIFVLLIDIKPVALLPVPISLLACLLTYLLTYSLIADNNTY